MINKMIYILLITISFNSFGASSSSTSSTSSMTTSIRSPIPTGVPRFQGRYDGYGYRARPIQISPVFNANPHPAKKVTTLRSPSLSKDVRMEEFKAEKDRDEKIFAKLGETGLVKKVEDIHDPIIDELIVENLEQYKSSLDKVSQRAYRDLLLNVLGESSITDSDSIRKLQEWGLLDSKSNEVLPDIESVVRRNADRLVNESIFID